MWVQGCALPCLPCRPWPIEAILDSRKTNSETTHVHGALPLLKSYRFWLAIGISLLFLGLFFSRIDLGETWEKLGEAD